MQSTWISDMGPTGDLNFDAANPDIAYDPIRDRYLVAWSGDDDSQGQIEGESEIFIHLLHGQNGTPLLASQIRISEVGGLGNSDYQARQPQIAFNPDDSEFLVVWRTCEDASVGGCLLTGQRIDALTSQPVGTDDRVLAAIAIGEPPAMAYSPSTGQYIVAVGVSDATPPAGIGAEIFTLRLSNEADPIGGPVRRSHMGIGTVGYFEAQYPAVATDETTGAIFVAWAGDHNEDGQVDDEYETFGLFLGPQIFSDGFESGNLSSWAVVSD